MEGTVNMEYRLSIAYAELGHSLDLPDRLLTVLLETVPESGPVICQDTGTGELTVTVAFESARPTDGIGRMSGAIESALVRAGVTDEPTLLDLQVTAVYDDEGFVSDEAGALQAA
jgi:hypothetical protein